MANHFCLEEGEMRFVSSFDVLHWADCSCRWPLGREYLRLMRLQKEANLTGYRNAWCSSSLEKTLLQLDSGSLENAVRFLDKGWEWPDAPEATWIHTQKSLIEGKSNVVTVVTSVFMFSSFPWHGLKWQMIFPATKVRCVVAGRLGVTRKSWINDPGVIRIATSTS